MIEPITLARPYARAAFEHARVAGELAQWQDALEQLAAVTRDHKVSVMLKSPSQTAQQRAENLAALIGDSLPASVVNLLMIMADNGRLSLLPEVAALFEQFKQAVESTVTVVVTSAYPLSDDETRVLSETMTSKLDRSVTLTSETDPSLLGGAIIRADDLVIDGSVRGRLDKLAGALTQ
ncbi:MAG: F0F1 ATP synthase subunit delta [Halieaceae bacterium]|jgi:F-type H+-transporting ATPase subunit delta|nr:F0F1 ATP synthase subunit delta [Halieaceae bacterium]